MNIFNLQPLSSILVLSGGIFYLAALIQSKFPPKRINYLYGYRTKASMQNLESWKFAQSYASKKMKHMSLYIFILGAFSSFLRFGLMWSLWIGIVTLVLMIALMIFYVEKELKNRFPKE